MAAHDPVISPSELESRTIFHADLIPDEAAFIDTRLPGSKGKLNYPLIGAGVSENAVQNIPVNEPHGFGLGAAVMRKDVTNSLHLHFTAEVFMCFGGEWRFRWGVEGDEGEAMVRDGDVISIPTWMFRGFTSESDDAWLYTALGRDVSGGLIWAPSVLEAAAEYGMYLDVDGHIVETEPGEGPPEGVDVIEPLGDEDLATLRSVSPEEMRERLARPDDLVWSSQPFVDSDLPTGGADLATVVGYGLTEDREQQPRVHEPHGLTLAWLRAEPGRGMSLHRHDHAQAVIVKAGRWRVTLNREEPVSVEVGPFDTVSIPVGAWRRFESIGDQTGQLAVITEGDGKVAIEWDPQILEEALANGVAHDANGYVAPTHLVGAKRRLRA
jgi:quercetin dioxygenase-like cupin family protein